MVPPRRHRWLMWGEFEKFAQGPSTAGMSVYICLPCGSWRNRSVSGNDRLAQVQILDSRLLNSLRWFGSSHLTDGIV